MDIQEQIKSSAIALRNQVIDNKDKRMIECFLMALVGKDTIVLSPIEHVDDNAKEYLQKHLRAFLSEFSESDYSVTVCDNKNYIASFQSLNDKLKHIVIDSLRECRSSFIIYPDKLIERKLPAEIFECEENKYAYDQLGLIIDELNKYNNYGNK